MQRTSRDIRVENRCEVLRQIIASGTVSRQEIAADTGLSPATVTNIVKELLAGGVVSDVGYQNSGGGRPRGVVAANTADGVLVGVDLADTHLHVGVYDLALTPLAEVEERAPEARGPDAVDAAIRAALRKSGRAGDRVLGVGVGARDEPPPLQHSPAWPVVVEHPLHAGVVAELWVGSGRNFGDVVVLSLGTEVGAGLAFAGKLYRGSSNNAGAWGHTGLVPGGRLCRCGRNGCVEAYVGVPGILRSVLERSPATPVTTVDALAADLRTGDPVAAEVVGELAGHLGAAVADLINLLNPDRVVLSGPVAGQLGEELLPDVRATVMRHALSRPLDTTEITLCRIPGNPVSLGLASLALEHFLATGLPSG